MSENYIPDYSDLSKIRRPYDSIKMSILQDYFDWSCNLVLNKNPLIKTDWTYDNMMSYSYDQIVHWCRTPIESLMLELVILILWGSKNSDVEAEKRIIIKEILCNNKIEDLVKDLTEEEKYVFLNDLKVANVL